MSYRAFILTRGLLGLVFFYFFPIHDLLEGGAVVVLKIYEIRGVKVMLDFDLAEAYGVETSQLKRQVRRNIESFEGDDFMIELTRDELSRCQIGTLNIKRGQNVK